VKVKELIAALQEYDEDMEVVVRSQGDDDCDYEKFMTFTTKESYDWDSHTVYPTDVRFGGKLLELCEKKPIIKVLLLE
jgi:hypothetical protein